MRTGDSDWRAANPNRHMRMELVRAPHPKSAQHTAEGQTSRRSGPTRQTRVVAWLPKPVLAARPRAAQPPSTAPLGRDTRQGADSIRSSAAPRTASAHRPKCVPTYANYDQRLWRSPHTALGVCGHGRGGPGSRLGCTQDLVLLTGLVTGLLAGLDGAGGPLKFGANCGRVRGEHPWRA